VSVSWSVNSVQLESQDLMRHLMTSPEEQFNGFFSIKYFLWLNIVSTHLSIVLVVWTCSSRIHNKNVKLITKGIYQYSNIISFVLELINRNLTSSNYVEKLIIDNSF